MLNIHLPELLTAELYPAHLFREMNGREESSWFVENTEKGRGVQKPSVRFLVRKCLTKYSPVTTRKKHVGEHSEFWKKDAALVMPVHFPLH